MQRIEDIKFLGHITKQKATVTGASASFDTLGCHSVLLSIIRGSSATATSKFYFYHASGSTTTAASGTAFGTIPSLSVATASAKYAVLIEGQTAAKRYLIVKLSKLTSSMQLGLQAIGFTNRAIPSTSTLGSYTSLSRPLV